LQLCSRRFARLPFVLLFDAAVSPKLAAGYLLSLNDRAGPRA